MAICGRRLDHYKEALLLAEQIGDLRTEARVLDRFGLAYEDLGEFGHALKSYRRALEANLEIGDRISEAQVLGNMGVAFLGIGDSDRAVEHHQRNVEVAREISDHRGKGIALGNLANAYRWRGELQRVVACYEQQAALVHGMGIGRPRRARSLTSLAAFWRPVSKAARFSATSARSESDESSGIDGSWRLY